MQIFFDESGNTGCVIPNKKQQFYDEGQRFFVLGGIITHSEQDKIELEQKYKEFKNRHNIVGEKKGSDLLTKENNDVLFDFIELLDDKHFSICVYDKIFYLASIISTYFMGIVTRNQDPLMFYTQTSALALEDLSFFQTFCDVLKDNTVESRKGFLDYVIDFDYKHIDPQVNCYIEFAKLMKEHNDYDEFPLPYGCYLNENITHLINLTALGESLLEIKVNNEEEFTQVKVHHDKIHEFEEEFKDTLSSHTNIDLDFVDSRDTLLIQVADNIASIFRKAFSKTVELFRTGKQWKSGNEFFPTLLSKILKKLSFNNVKFDTQICDMVLSFCINELYDEKFPVNQRNNFTFISLFAHFKSEVLTMIANTNYDTTF